MIPQKCCLTAKAYLSPRATLRLAPSISLPSTFPASLVQGLNVIQVKVKNGPNPSDCGSNQYQCNPAGVVLGASFEDTLSALPTCTDNGRTFTVPELETFSCSPGQTGHAFRPCLCIGSSGFWGPTYSACASPPSPPPTCTDNGKTFSVGDTEPVSCPSGQTGSASRTCQPDGGWGPTTGTCTTPPPPPPTCTDSGRTFAAGQIETLACPPGQTGSQTRTCNTNGTWGQTPDTCKLPTVPAGAMCGAIDKGVTATCPSGTTCGPRLGTVPARPWTCFFGINCPVRTQTADWYCDPP